MFVHLHNHTDYSLLDGACRISELVESALAFGSPAVGITDHGNMFGALDFYTKCKAAGLKPIIGCELYLAPGSRTIRKPGREGELRYHQVLLAKNLTGYRNLSRLCSEGYLSGFYYKPRIDKDLLRRHTEGIICLSSCLQGEVPQMLLNGQTDEAFAAMKFYKELFGDDFYVELMRHNLPEQQRLEPTLLQMAQDIGAKVVATNDAHYLRREHARAHEVLLCVGTQTNLTDPKRLRFGTDEFYFKSPQEMRELFADLPEASDATLEIADKCNLEIPLGGRNFPVFKITPEMAASVEVGPDEPPLEANRFLEKLARRGFKQRYGDQPPEEARRRLDQELQVITQTGFADYFLIVWDFVRWAKERGIMVGPGRGSAAGSIVSYCLRITDIDPLEYGLIFERFLNPERVSPPDIDIDFADNRREEVIEYVRERYGRDCVCRITTFGHMAARSAVRDVARAMGMSYAEGDRIARLVPEGTKDMTIDRALAEVPELRELVNSDPRYRDLVMHARLVEGAVRHASTHAAGVVICPGPTMDYLPVCIQGDDGEIYTQFDMNWMEAVGLLKMDFLGLQTLQELDLTLASLRKKGIDLDLSKIPLDDPEVYRLFAEGDTTGVFQFESHGMRDNLVKLKPERLEDLIAMNALYRPGPMQMIDEFIACRHGRKRAEYLHPSLEPILRATYGVVVYQEQVIRIVTELAGYSLGKADLFRRAMGKKKPEIMKEQEEPFIQGCVNRGISRKTAKELFAACEQFAGYGFVKAHSAGYALIAYQCAYLKRYYPAEYLAACLTVRSRDQVHVMKLLAECRAKGLAVLPPDINESEAGFVAAGGGIRFGLGAVKNVGEAAILNILDARRRVERFTSLVNFLESVDLRVVNRRVVESLIDAGAFDDLGPNRASLLASLGSAMAYAQAVQDERLNGQSSIFGGGEAGLALPAPADQQVDEWPLSEKQAREKAVLGYYVSSHPLSRFAREIEQLASHRLADRDEFTDGLKVRVCGVISSVRHSQTKAGETMARAMLEDLTGSIECLIFPAAYQKNRALIQPDALVAVTGRISRQSTPGGQNGEEPKLKVEEILPLPEIVKRWSQSLRIILSTNQVTEPLVALLEQALASHPGECPVLIDLVGGDDTVQTFKVGRYQVEPTADLVKRLEELFGSEKVALG